jgi:hypothetical protein
VFTNPSERTFVEITRHPDAQAKAAYIWLFIAGTLSALITSLTRSVILRQIAPLIENMVPGYGQMTQLPGGPLGMFGATIGLLGTVCSSVISGAFTVGGFAIGVTLVHAAASALGGRGSFDRLAYALGAISVPALLLSSAMTLLSTIPYAVLCTLPLLLALGLYVMILQITAIKAVYRSGWGTAMVSLFAPGFLMFLMCGVLLLLVRLALPAIAPQMPQGIP